MGLIEASLELGVPRWVWRDYPHGVVLLLAISLTLLISVFLSCTGSGTKRPQRIKKL